MPFSRPSLSTIIKRIQGDFESRMEGTSPLLTVAVTRVFAIVYGAAVHSLYGFISFVADQLFPDTATGEYLERWTRLWGIYRKQASLASGSITITGVDGNTVPDGAVWQRADGTEYVQDGDATVAAGTATVVVTAEVEHVGEIGNAEEGVKLTLVEGIAGVDSEATVTVDGISGGHEKETDVELLIRFLERLRSKPQGGANADYIAWAKEVAGVTRAWVYPREQGAGTVVVRFMMDNDYADGIPQAADVTAVQDHIAASAPVTAEVYAVAPIADQLDFTIQLAPNTQAVRDAVEAELDDLLVREAAPGVVIPVSHIREAISVAAGETDHVLIAPAADVNPATGYIPVKGNVNFQNL